MYVLGKELLFKAAYIKGPDTKFDEIL